MKDWLVKHIRDNLPTLLRADIRVASWFNVPEHCTISGNAYRLEMEGKPVGRFLRPAVDGFFFWLWGQEGHCKQAYNEDLERQKNA